MSESPQQGSEVVDADQDRYPTAREALRRILEEGNLPDGAFEWLDVSTFASGEVCYRVRLPRAEYAEVGYLPPAEVPNAPR